MGKYKSPQEWIRQAEYDLETAQAMFDAGRYIYTIFMSHLSIEKAVKAVYASVFEDNPPKTHHLLFLIEKIQSKINFQIPENIFGPIRQIDKLSVPVRYPEDLQDLNKSFHKTETQKTLNDLKVVLEWLKMKLN